MATIVHRRPMRPVAPVLRGPGASLAALTPIGWGSLILAVGWMVVAVLPALTVAEARQLSWGTVAYEAWFALPDATLVGLPAALEWGVPGARRRVPWLMRGAVLLAVAALADEALSRVWWLLWESLSTDPWFGGLGEESFPGGLGFVPWWLLEVGTAVLALSGAWALADGLADAGGQLGRRVLGAVVAAGVVLGSFWLPIGAVVAGMDLDPVQVVTSLASSLLGVGMSVLWLVIAARLVAGWRAGVCPRRAWAVGAVAGVGTALSQVAFLAVLVTGIPGGVPVLAAMVHVLPDVLLVVAFLAGLGRGRERREDPPRRRRLAVVWGPAAG